MIKTLPLFIFLIGLGSMTSKNQDVILGVWYTPKQDGKIEIYEVDNHYYGTLISYTMPYATDINNPDPALRSRAVVGLNIIQDFVYDDAHQQWVNGTIYDPENGKTYTGSLWVDKKDPNQLKARGYVLGMTILGRTETFTRAE